MRAEPAANLATAGVMRTGRSSSGLRPFLKVIPLATAGGNGRVRRPVV